MLTCKREGNQKTAKHVLGTKISAKTISILFLIFYATALVLCMITNQRQEHVELDDQNDNIKKGIASFGFDTYL